MTFKTPTNLPPENLRDITSFMTGSDAVSFSTTCRQINRDLNIGILENMFSIENLFRSGGDDKFHLWMEIPLPLQEKLHSIHLNARWRDQGWGNRTGRVAITSSIHELTPDIVVNSDIAGHSASRLNLEFKVQPGKKYYLMYRVGDGGGHSLHVWGINFTFLIHGAGVAKMHSGGFEIALLEATASSVEIALENNGRNPNRHLELVLRNFGLPGVHRETIDSLRDMARLLREKKDKVETFQDSGDDSDSEGFDY